MIDRRGNEFQSDHKKADDRGIVRTSDSSTAYLLKNITHQTSLHSPCFFQKCAYKSLNLLKTLIVSSLKLVNSTLIFLFLSSDNTSLIDDIEL